MRHSATADDVVRSIAGGDGRVLRSDGQRNRDLVVRAALEIFAADGMMGTVEKIAERAGVSRTTVYRSFPTRQALQVAVATSQFLQIHRIALDAQAHSGGTGVGLIDFVFGAFEYNQANRLYLELFSGRPTDEMRDVHTASRRTIAELTDEARAAGVIRAEVTDEDVARFTGGLSVRLAADHTTAPQDWRRTARLALIGLGVAEALLPPHRVPRAHLDPGVADA
ncbi:TetR/AcrR family transcriptional regulator [Dactylosporangium sp. CA-092794]|uniref:TetR/AcrR family transcriptional regulator n=1 Tax=Dactylosporangium sp. CA-092794 TaxID=3239929 RepID=UPI003D8C75DB